VPNSLVLRRDEGCFKPRIVRRRVIEDKAMVLYWRFSEGSRRMNGGLHEEVLSVCQSLKSAAFYQPGDSFEQRPIILGGESDGQKGNA
jgi:hypothetical protein